MLTEKVQFNFFLWMELYKRETRLIFLIRKSVGLLCVVDKYHC